MLNRSRDLTGGSPPDPGRRDVDFGLVIGVDHYSGNARLRGAVKDAELFHAWLCLDSGGGISAEHARLIGPDGTPRPWSLAVAPDLYKLEAGTEHVTFDHDGEEVLHVDF